MDWSDSALFERAALQQGIKTCISLWTSCEFSVMTYKSGALVVLCFLRMLTQKLRAQKCSWIITLQPKIWRETVAQCDHDRHFIFSIFAYSVDQALVLSSWQLPDFWEVSYSSCHKLWWVTCFAFSVRDNEVSKLLQFWKPGGFFCRPPVVAREHRWYG